jgi:hypothetical protein
MDLLVIVNEETAIERQSAWILCYSLMWQGGGGGRGICNFCYKENNPVNVL